MKLVTGTVIDIESTGEDGLDCNISANNTALMFEILSSQIYANPIGSLVREITSNCFDSHMEAGIEDAVLVRFIEEEDVEFISFVDVGVGLSPERMDKVYSNYLESTKRLTNGQLGMWGLGSKSPLAYQDSFQVITRFDGIEYFYIVHKGEKGIPRIEKMYEVDTTERNGTEVRIEIKKDPHASWRTDKSKFRDELKRQLCYFDNVYFENWDIDNNYTIHETTHFLFRDKDQYSPSMHIVLGKVAYPIDWDTIGMKRHDFPVGVKFEIGELQVTPSRESLKYTEETKALVRERVELSIKEIIELYNAQRTEMTFFDFHKDRIDKRTKWLHIGNGMFQLSGIRRSELDPYEIPGFSGEIPEDPFKEFTIRKYISNGGRIKYDMFNVTQVLMNNSNTRRTLRLKGNMENKEKNLYLFDTIGTCYMLERAKMSAKMMKRYLSLSFNKHGGAYGVKLQIEAYRKHITHAIVERYESYDRMEIDEQ